MSEAQPSGRQRLSGWLLMSVVVLAIAAEIVPTIPDWLPGAVAAKARASTC
jgi:hypothetical protein